MVLFDKIANYFKKPVFEAPSAPENTPISAPVVAPPAAPALSMKELFLEELRSIPVRHSSIEAGREDLMKELKRITPNQDRLS